MATDKEIKQMMSWVERSRLILLHCVSKYPCKDSHLERIEEIKKLYPIVGLSDHTKDIYINTNVPILEKHIMLHGVDAIDENVSLYPEEFKEMVDYIRGKE